MYCERVKISWLTRSPSDKYFMTFEPYKDFALCLVIVYLRTRTTKKFAQSEINISSSLMIWISTYTRTFFRIGYVLPHRRE